MNESAKPKGRAVRLRITSCAVGWTGKNKRGYDTTIYEVEACKENGEVVAEPLRSFEDLPLELLDLNVVVFDSEHFGRSFTLSRRNKPKTAELIAAQQVLIEELKTRLERVEAFLRKRSQPEPISEPVPEQAMAKANAALTDDLDQRFGA